MEKLAVNVKEMGELLGVSRCTAYELIHQQGFPVVWLGKRAVIPIDSLKKWLNEQAQAQTSGVKTHERRKEVDKL